ncbi:thioredoxin family protein [uncultured Kriegella sp.]|uniref:TlpA family protein disulfide reductase n=1 Tax=uncultured Kriegella sp. TaxID=1798910 RepID=UPI0030D9A7AC|tara:strand:+ start:53624 stop:54952 length:1329 start_codon:yes stop_codon:yes gene_type:complete
MRNTFFAFLFLTTFLVSSQHNISGTFAPAKDYTWLLAYRLTPSGEAYVADTAIDKGKFTLKIPENSRPGTYRLVYAVPKEEFFFDVIYNGKEDIQLDFNADQGVRFLESEENIHFATYFNEINQLELQIVNFYSQEKTDVPEFEAILKKMSATQQSFESKTEGLLCNVFIKANRPFIPDSYVSVFDYVRLKKDNYFKYLDINKTLLQASAFLTDKLTNYVFTALPLKEMTQAQMEKAMEDNVRTLDGYLSEVGNSYKFHVFHTLWNQATANNFNLLSDYIYSDYLKLHANTAEQQQVINEIDANNRLRIGAVAPDIIWKESNSVKKLSTLSGAKNYVLIFWSSTCSHCLKELPQLHKALSHKSSVKVVAIGLEDDDSTWKTESAKLENFEHAISLGKWESEYAKTYAIDHTPTYFILDNNKKILAKPESDKDVISFLEANED